MNLLMKEIKKDDKPREKIIKNGIRSLTNEELLAVLLRTGSKGKSVLELARSILKYTDDLSEFSNLTLEELTQIKGVKAAKATTIIAAIELGLRLLNKNIQKTPYIRKSKDVYMVVKEELMPLLQEHFICLFLDTKYKLIKKETIFIGTINKTLIHPRDIFRLAVKYSAVAIILVHNHPTGDATASSADYEVTESLVTASNIIGIDLLDHIVVGKNEFFSIKENKKYFSD